MNAQKVLELVNRSRFGELRELAEKEIRTNAAKQRGGTSEAKRQKAAEKLIKDMAKNKPSFAGAMYHGGTQYITNGYLCAALPEGKHLDLAPASMSIETVAQWFEKQTTPIAIDWPGLETAHSLHIAHHGRAKKAPLCIVQVGDQYFNAALLREAVAILGGDCTAAHENNVLTPLHLHNDNGECILMPMGASEQNKVSAVDVTIEGNR